MNLRSALALVFSLIMGITVTNAQDKYGSEPDKCKTNLSLFHEAVKQKNFDGALNEWKWCFDNCPKASKLIYTDGLKIFEDKYDKNAGLMKVSAGQKIKTNDVVVKVGREYFDTSKANKAELAKLAKQIDAIYNQRIKYFPENLGKVYSDWADFYFKRGAVEGVEVKKQIYDKLAKSFNADPTGMSVKNLAHYFRDFTELHKDKNPQLVFDTYDEITEAVQKKMDRYSKEFDALKAKEESGKTLSKREKAKKHAREVNLTALGQVEGFLDQTLAEIATCERLIPLYRNSLEKHKTDAQWLKRAVSRLFQKECTSDPIYPKMVEVYVNADPSSEAYVFYAGILQDRGENSKALEYFNKAISLEKDPYKKAKIYYRVAKIFKARGAKSKSREFCYKAIKERPSFGHAYLLISSLYASSANSCGEDEFSKRMVYVAAANMARKAKAVDPGITSLANKYIKSYMASAPSKKLIFKEGRKSGTPFKIGCWINETVKIP